MKSEQHIRSKVSSGVERCSVEPMILEVSVHLAKKTRPFLLNKGGGSNGVLLSWYNYKNLYKSHILSHVLQRDP